MLVIQCDTSHFIPGERNGLKCGGCRRMVAFDVTCSSILITSVGVRFTVVRDAETGHVIHDCRQEPLVTQMGDILRDGLL